MFRKKHNDIPELDDKKVQEIMETVKNSPNLKHIAANWGIVMVAYYGLSGYMGEVHALGIGFVSALSISLFKEVMDDKASPKDLVKDFIGIGLGLLTVWLGVM